MFNEHINWLHILECAIRIGCPVAMDTDGRDSDVITKPQIPRIDGLSYFLPHGAPL